MSRLMSFKTFSAMSHLFGKISIRIYDDELVIYAQRLPPTVDLALCPDKIVKLRWDDIDYLYSSTMPSLTSSSVSSCVGQVAIQMLSNCQKLGGEQLTWFYMEKSAKFYKKLEELDIVQRFKRGVPMLGLERSDGFKVLNKFCRDLVKERPTFPQEYPKIWDSLVKRKPIETAKFDLNDPDNLRSVEEELIENSCIFE